jgi:fibronectin-binding autotransporter adhesin
MPDPNTGASPPDGSNRWSNPANWSAGLVPQNFDDVIFPVLPVANKVAVALPSGNPFVNGRGPRNDLSTGQLSVLNSVTISDSGYDIFSDPFNPGANASLQLQSDFTADMAAGVSTWGIGIAISSGGATPIQTFNVVNNLGTMSITGNISETAANSILRKVGAGTLALGGNNIYTGLTQVEAGSILVTSPTGLGVATGSQGTVVTAGASVIVQTDVDPAEALQISGDGGGGGALSGSGSWNGPITLVGDTSIGAAGTLSITGIIGTTVGGNTLTKVGGGTLELLNNNNNYQFDTVVNAGTLRIFATAPNALSPGFTTTVNSGANLQLVGNLTLNSENLLTINGAGSGNGSLNTQGGASTNALVAIPVVLGSDSSIGGDRGSVLTIGVPTPTPSGGISGAFNLTKVGDNTVILPIANTGYSGTTTINRGLLILRDGQALGLATGGPVIVNNNGTLQLEQDQNAPINNTYDKQLTLNGSGFDGNGALRTSVANTDVVYAGDILLGSSSLINNDALTRLTVTGIINGAANISLTKTGSGTLVLIPMTGNTYLGATTVAQGVLAIQDPSALGGVSGQGTFVQNGATLQIQGSIAIQNEALTLSGLGFNGQGALESLSGNNTISGPVTLLSQAGALQAGLQVDNAGDTLTFNNVVGGGADLLKTGAGTLLLTGGTSNTLSGSAIVNAGTLILNKSSGLVAVGGGLTVGDGLGGDSVDVALLGADGQITPSANVRVNSSGLFDLQGFRTAINQLTLQGGVVNTGAGLLLLGNDVTSLAALGATPAEATSFINGNLSLGATTRTFNVADDARLTDDLIVNAILSENLGAGAGLIKTGLGTMRLDQTTAYTGPTTISGGTLKLNAGNNTLPTTALTVNGALDLNNFNQTASSLTGGATGSLLLGSGTLTTGSSNASTTYAGSISGTGSLTKVGSGTLTLAGNGGSYLGTTNINAGTVLVNGNQGSAAVQVAPGTTLGGLGTVGRVTVAGVGVLSPGDSSVNGGAGQLNVNGDGMLATRDVTLNSSSTFLAQINGTTAGTSYDRLDVVGSIDLGSSKLQTNFGYNANPGDTFTILHASEGIFGTFAGLADGDKFTNNGRVFRINYVDTDGLNGADSVVITTESLSTNLTLTSSAPGGASFGQPVTFTITVAQSVGAAIPTGTVNFFVDGNPVGNPSGVTLVSGMASITIPDGMVGNTAFLTGGTHLINAAYSGDASYPPGNASIQQQINRVTPTVSLTGSSPSIFGQQTPTVSFTATVSTAAGTGIVPTGDVVFVDQTTGMTLGQQTLDGSGQATLVINTTPQNTLSAGVHSIRANYVGLGSGDTNYNTSSSVPFTQTVSQAMTSTDVQTSGTSTFGEKVTFTATVLSNTSTPSGTVTFSKGGQTLGTVTLDASGVAKVDVFDLPVGNNQTITATFNASNNFTGSSNTVSQSVTAGSTATSLIGSLSSAAFGQPVTFTATVSPVSPSTLTPTGSVTFVAANGGPTIPLGTVALVDPDGDKMGPAQALLTIPPPFLDASGTPYTITATYSPSAGYTIDATVSNANQTSLQVNAATTTITIQNPVNPSVFGQPISFTAVVSAAPSVAVPTGSVDFSIDSGPAMTVMLDSSGRAVLTSSVPLSVGMHTVSATYTSNDPNFVSTGVGGSSGPANFTQTVNTAPTTVAITSSGTPSSPGQSVTFTATVSGSPSALVPPGTVTFLVDGSAATVLSLNASGQAFFTTANLNLGSRTITAVFSSSNATNFADSTSAPFTQVVRQDYYAVGTDAGVPGQVEVYDGDSRNLVAVITPFDSFTGGVRVAVGDVNGDGYSDIIVGAGPGAPGGHVKVFSGNGFGLISSYFAFVGFTGGVNVAAGDIDGDGKADIIVGAGPGAPGGHVRAFSFDGTLLSSYFAFPGFTGGVTVAAGDVNGDHTVDIIVGAGPGAPGGHVKAFTRDGTLLASFFAYPGFTGGVNVAAGDVDGDGRAEIITGAASVVTHVKVIDGNGQIRASFIAHPGAPIGIRVGAVDRDGDGKDDILTGAAASVPHVEIFSGLTLGVIDSFFAFGPLLGTGIFVGGIS